MEYLNFWSGLLISAVCFAILFCAVCKSESERRKSSNGFCKISNEVKKPVIKKHSTTFMLKRGNSDYYTCRLNGDTKCIAYGESPKDAYAKWFWMIYNKDTD